MRSSVSVDTQQSLFVHSINITFNYDGSANHVIYEDIKGYILLTSL